MQREPAPAGSVEPKQDSALPPTPTMPPPESLSEDQQSSPGHSPTEVRLDLGRRGLGLVDLPQWRERREGRGDLAKPQREEQTP